MLGNDAENEVSYQSVTIDYMRDVFRPKVFVKAGTTPSPTENKLFTSIYGGLDGEHTESQEKKIVDLNCQSYFNSSFNSDTKLNKMEDEEEKEAMAYRNKILEIEKKLGCIQEVDETPTLMDDQPSIQFKTKLCGCKECSPVVLENGLLHCALCDISIQNDSWQTHKQSICHQIRRSRGNHMYINPYMNPSSQAYHVMQSMGWSEGEGLGYEGQGILHPIATRLKDNRLGVGAEDDMPLRVTHTPHNGDADPHEDPAITRERERLIKKYGLKRLKRIIKKYHEKKKKIEQQKKEKWLRDEFRM